MARRSSRVPHHYVPSRKRRYIRFPRRLAVFAALCCAFIGASVGFSFIPQLAVRDIRVESTGLLSGDVVRDVTASMLSERAFGIFAKRNIVTIRSEEIEARIRKEFPRIADVQVSKSWKDRALNITVSERMLWAVACKRSEPRACVYVDESGVAFAEAPESFGSLIPELTLPEDAAFSLGSVILSSEEREYVRALLAASATDVYPRFREIALREADNGMTVHTTEGWMALMTLNVSAPLAFENLRLALAEEIKEKRAQLDYIDVRYGSKVFYKLRSGL